MLLWTEATHLAESSDLRALTSPRAARVHHRLRQLSEAANAVISRRITLNGALNDREEGAARRVLSSSWPLPPLSARLCRPTAPSQAIARLAVCRHDWFGRV